MKGENPTFYRDNLALFAFPAVTGGTGDPKDLIGTVGDNFYSVSSTCKDPANAFKLIQYLIDDKSVEEAGRALLAHFGSSAVLITRGGKGMSLIEETSPRALHIPATGFEVTYARVGQIAVDRNAAGRQVFEVTGAGDTVLRVLALAAAAGAPLSDAAILGNTAAGVAVSKLGTATVTPDELIRALDETHH